MVYIALLLIRIFKIRTKKQTIYIHFFERIFSNATVKFLPKQISVSKNKQYSTIPEKRGTDNKLYFSADIKSKCSMEINALVIPHPGHLFPIVLYIGQSEPLKVFVKAYSNKNNTQAFVMK